MKVYVVSHPNYRDDRTVCGVFDSRERAEAAIAEIQASETTTRTFLTCLDLNDQVTTVHRALTEVDYTNDEPFPPWGAFEGEK